MSRREPQRCAGRRGAPDDWRAFAPRHRRRQRLSMRRGPWLDAPFGAPLPSLFFGAAEFLALASWLAKLGAYAPRKRDFIVVIRAITKPRRVYRVQDGKQSKKDNSPMTKKAARNSRRRSGRPASTPARNRRSANTANMSRSGAPAASSRAGGRKNAAAMRAPASNAGSAACRTMINSPPIFASLRQRRRTRSGRPKRAAAPARSVSSPMDPIDDDRS